MILLVNPRITRPKNRRFPLSVLALGAVLEGSEDYCIVDGNLEPDLWTAVRHAMDHQPATALAVTVMPGPQLSGAVELSRRFRQAYPGVAIVWGGYFPSLYPDTALNADYVNFVIRGQGEDTFVELLRLLRSGGDLSRIRGLSYKDDHGRHRHNPRRPLRSPGDYPWFPYHRIEADRYILPTFLGSRTAVHQASIGCPFRCNFCGVVPLFESEKAEPPSRTEAILRHLRRTYGVNAIQFYDNNFFLGEERTRELAERLAPLNLQWWCEGRVDTVAGYSHDTLRLLRRAGCVMIFFGVESGSDETLRRMNKNLTTAQVVRLARRIRTAGIVPEFSLIFGDPQDPEGDVRRNIDFARALKKVNPDAEIVIQTYVPVPQPGPVFGLNGRFPFPETPEQWLEQPWQGRAAREDPQLPWLPSQTRRRIRDFETVLRARWPTVQDANLPRWGRALLKAAGSWRYAFGVYRNPVELQWLEQMLKLRQPRLESL